MAAAIIYPDIIKFTKRIQDELGINKEKYSEYIFREDGLVVNPYKGCEILLLPKDILHELPIAKCWDDINRVVSENENIRREINEAVGEEWSRWYSRDKKACLKEHIFKDPEKCSRVIEGYRKSEVDKYDLNNDVEYFAAALIKTMKREGINFAVEGAKEKDSFKTALDVLDIFKDWVEYNKGWDTIQGAESSKREKIVQRFIHLGSKNYPFTKRCDMKTNQYLIDFYNTYDEDSRLKLKHGTVEFLTTMRYIEKYISAGNHVLEIGAGTGRYSHALARQGYTVDAVELVSHNIDVFRKNTLPGENITVIQGNALDLSFISDDQYDITLLLGPLYHLYSSEDKRQALREAIRVTKQGGIIFAAYVISDGCLLDEGFNRGNINVAEYIQNGLLDAETFAAKSEPKDLFELVRKEDIDELMSVFSTSRLHYVAADGCSLLMREAIDKMDDDTFELYLKYHFATCEREDLAGVTSHAIDIFKK